MHQVSVCFSTVCQGHIDDSFTTVSCHVSLMGGMTFCGLFSHYCLPLQLPLPPPSTLLSLGEKVKKKMTEWNDPAAVEAGESQELKKYLECF